MHKAKVERHLRKVSDRSGYSRVVRDVPGRTDRRTGEIIDPRQRKRKVHRRVRRMRGGSGFLSVNSGPVAAADIARIIGAALRDSDFFYPAPNHQPRSVAALHEDFHRENTVKPYKLRASQLDHLACRLLGVQCGGHEFGPTLPSRESEFDVLGSGHEGLPSFLREFNLVNPFVMDEARAEYAW